MIKQENRDELMTCPQCGTVIQKIHPYIPWCEQCNWNLRPKRKDHSDEHSLLDRLYHWLSRGFDSRLHKQMVTHTKTGISFASIVAVCLSTIFYCVIIFLTIYAIILGLSLVWWKLLLAFAIVLFLYWSIHPRFEVSPPTEVLTLPDKFPVLNEIIGRISAQLKIATPKILLTEQFTATFASLGWPRQSLLILGHPWLTLLSPHELVTLISHELAHNIDGNISRSLYVRIAETAVMRWVSFFNPMRWFFSFSLGERKIPIPILPLNIAFFVIFLPLLLLKMIFLVCSRRNMQRAEYVADRFSAEISGNHESLSLLHKSLYRYLDPLIIPYRRSPYDKKYQLLLNRIKVIPPREIERLWRLAQLDQPVLHDTHPPLWQRAAFLDSLPRTTPKVGITPEEFEALHKELQYWPTFVQNLESVLLADGFLKEPTIHFMAAMLERKIAYTTEL